MKYILDIINYKVNVFLGNNDGEQDHKRPVIINIQISFNNKPDACDSDNISETLCYDNLLHHVYAGICDKHFNLIENMAQFIYNLIKNYIVIPADIQVEIIKQYPMSDVEATSFIISDD